MINYNIIERLAGFYKVNILDKIAYNVMKESNIIKKYCEKKIGKLTDDTNTSLPKPSYPE